MYLSLNETVLETTVKDRPKNSNQLQHLNVINYDF
jgi:hypothetical protein